MHPRSRRGVGRSPLSKSRRLSVSIVIVIIIVLNVTVHTAYSLHPRFFLFHFAVFEVVQSGYRADSKTGSRAQRKYILSLPLFFISSLRFSLHLPAVNLLHAPPHPKTTPTTSIPGRPPFPSPPLSLHELLFVDLLLMHSLHMSRDVHLLLRSVDAMGTLELGLLTALPLLMVPQAALQLVNPAAGRTIEALWIG